MGSLMCRVREGRRSVGGRTAIYIGRGKGACARNHSVGKIHISPGNSAASGNKCPGEVNVRSDISNNTLET